MTKKLKMYGERNTNTNYMSKLIQLNLELQEIRGTVPHYVDKAQRHFQRLLSGNEQIKDIYFDLTFGKNLGWKHSCVQPTATLKNCKLVDEELIFITITKNPYSWLLSLYRNPYHQYYLNQKKPSFEEFLLSPWKTVGRDKTQRSLKDPIELWNIKNSSYLQLQEFNVLNITTESIFIDAGKIICEISDRFSVPRKHDCFVDYERSTKDKRKDGNYYRDYYLNEKWKDKFSNNEITIINQTVDRKLMDYFGYEVLL